MKKTLQKKKIFHNINRPPIEYVNDVSFKKHKQNGKHFLITTKIHTSSTQGIKLHKLQLQQMLFVSERTITNIFTTSEENANAAKRDRKVRLLVKLITQTKCLLNLKVFIKCEEFFLCYFRKDISLYFLFLWSRFDVLLEDCVFMKYFSNFRNFTMFFPEK